MPLKVVLLAELVLACTITQMICRLSTSRRSTSAPGQAARWGRNCATTSRPTWGSSTWGGQPLQTGRRMTTRRSSTTQRLTSPFRSTSRPTRRSARSSSSPPQRHRMQRPLHQMLLQHHCSPTTWTWRDRLMKTPSTEDGHWWRRAPPLPR